MAEAQDDIAVAEESGGKTKLLMIIIAVLLLAVIGLGVFMFMGNSADDAEAVAESSVKQSPIYYSIEDPFIVNFSKQSNDAVRYMQVKMKVMARDQAVIDAVQLNLPAIQHELLMLLFSQKYDDLQTSEGTQQLQQACLETINRIIHADSDVSGDLEAVYFTSFIMQ